MKWLRALSPNMLGGVCAAISVVFFSINDMTIKVLADDYALHQVVLFRSVIGLTLVLLVIAPLTDGRRIWRTKRLHMHLVRSSFVVIANMTFFAGLAALPLADAVAIFFVSPLVITVFSVIFLNETVGPWRWGAIAVGFIGVLIIVQPGTSAFQVASLLPMVAACFYAGLHILTRKIGGTESAATMIFYMQLMFIVICAVIGLAIGDGRFGAQDNESLAFLLRAWRWPDMADAPLFLIIGVGVGIAGYLISQAYRVAEAGFVAPFEYLAMPLAILWGFIFFDEIPTLASWIGSILIIGSGLFTLWREQRDAARVAE